MATTFVQLRGVGKTPSLDYMNFGWHLHKVHHISGHYGAVYNIAIQRRNGMVPSSPYRVKKKQRSIGLPAGPDGRGV